MTNENDTKTTKKIGEYTLYFDTSFDLRSSNKIYLILQMNKDLQTLLKSVIIDEVTELNDNLLSETLSHERYKVKAWLYNALSTSRKGYLFIKSFLDDGKIKIAFENADDLERVADCIRRATLEAIEKINKFHNFKTMINFEVEGRK